MNRDFNKWLDNFKSSISNYSYYVDFEKIYKSAEKYKVEFLRKATLIMIL